MVLIVQYGEEESVLLTKRTSYMKNHGGQISFPGGSVDDDDSSPWDTALRETYEEVGIAPSLVKPLGSLPSQKVFVSNFIVYPVIGVLEGSWTLKDFEVNPQEVDRLYLCKIDSFSDNPPVKERVFKGVSYSYPVYDLEDGSRVWGATARILRNFLSLRRSSSKKLFL